MARARAHALQVVVVWVVVVWVGVVWVVVVQVEAIEHPVASQSPPRPTTATSRPRPSFHPNVYLSTPGHCFRPRPIQWIVTWIMMSHPMHHDPQAQHELTGHMRPVVEMVEDGEETRDEELVVGDEAAGQ